MRPSKKSSAIGVTLVGARNRKSGAVSPGWRRRGNADGAGGSAEPDAAARSAGGSAAAELAGAIAGAASCAAAASGAGVSGAVAD